MSHSYIVTLADLGATPDYELAVLNHYLPNRRGMSSEELFARLASIPTAATPDAPEAQ